MDLEKRKPRWTLMPWEQLTEVCKVFTFGADKYSDWGWKDVAVADQVYLDAAMRHISARLSGEIFDAESGHSHLSHAVCCLLAVMWHDNQFKEEIKERAEKVLTIIQKEYGVKDEV